MEREKIVKIIKGMLNETKGHTEYATEKDMALFKEYLNGKIEAFEIVLSLLGEDTDED